MYLFYNLMTARNKAGTPYLTALGHSLNSAGEIDLVSLVNDAMEGPVVAQGNWRQQPALCRGRGGGVPQRRRRQPERHSGV